MPRNMPAADEHLDTDRVRTLLREQFPDLAGLPLTPLANGWDNTLLRLGGDLLVRLPRREPAARLVLHEQRWLPALASRLPLPVPTPVRVGRPSATYPWSWSITRFFPGTDAGQATRFDTDDAARELGRFLAALHTTAPPEAPTNPVRGVPLRRRDDSFQQNLDQAGDAIDAAAARAIWHAALAATPWTRAPVWFHGDLHPANIVVRDGQIAAVIDFGDLAAGDPATDLAAAWMLFPRPSRATFWDAYASRAGHPVDADLRLRAHGWATAFAAVFLAHSADNPAMTQIGVRTAAAVLEPPTSDDG